MSRPLPLTRLERPQIEVLAVRLAGGKALPAEVVQHIVQKTDGVPLFVEEIAKAVLGCQRAARRWRPLHADRPAVRGRRPGEYLARIR